MDVEKGTCSFCKNDNLPVILQPKTNATICFSCVYRALEVTGIFPNGAVYCFHCESIEGFTISYKGGGKTSWELLHNNDTSLVKDSEDNPVYVVKSAVNFRPPIQPDLCNCNNCGHSLPTWVLLNNPHVQQAHLKNA